MNKQVAAYLDAVCAQIRWQAAHEEIRRELESHIEDLVAAGMAEGLSEAAAVERAMAQMGAPEPVGESLNETHRPRTDWALVAGTAMLVLLGVWAMHAVEVSGSYLNGTAGLIGSKVLWSAVGVGLAAGLFIVDYRSLQRLAWPLFGLTLAGILLTPPFVPPVLPFAHELSRFLMISPILFAPALAGIFASWDWNHRLALVKALGLLAVPSLVYLLGERVFPFVQYLVLFVVVCLGSRPHPRQLSILGVSVFGVAGSLGLYILSKPWRMERLLVWLTPQRDPLGAGYQVVQSLKAIRAAGPWGQGPLANLELVPEVPTDFVFAYLVHTLGWVAGVSITLLALSFIWRMVRAARLVRTRFGTNLVRAMGGLFGVAFGWNILMTLGVVPVMSVDLPLISHGAQQALYLGCVGLVLSVLRRRSLGGLSA